MKKINIFILSIILMLTFGLSAAPQYSISGSVLSSGGGTASGSIYKIEGTLGQPMTGITSGTSYKANEGFRYNVYKTYTTVYAPLNLNAVDNPGDEGGYVKLTFTACRNHPGMSGDIDEVYPIEKYYIYKGTTNVFSEASKADSIDAAVLTTSTDTIITAVVSTEEDFKTNFYFWVVSGKNGTVSTEEGPNRAIGARRSIYEDINEDGTIGLSDLSLFAWAYGNINEYDPMFDSNDDGVVGLSDLSYFAGLYGTSVGKPSLNKKVYPRFSGKINIDKKEINGKNFSIDINMVSPGKITGYQFIISYSPDDFELINSETGNVLKKRNKSKPLEIARSETGKMILACASAGTDNNTETGTEGTAASLEFRWISDNVSPIKLKEILVLDEKGSISSSENILLKEPVKKPVPDRFTLHQNYPNPFNPETTIKYELPEKADVIIEIYNTIGQKIKTLINETKEAGYYEIKWDARNDKGIKVNSGIFIYRIKAGSYTDVRKMILLK